MFGADDAVHRETGCLRGGVDGLRVRPGRRIDLDAVKAELAQERELLLPAFLKRGKRPG